MSLNIALTAEYQFDPTTGDYLFSVNPGIPLSDAFDKLSSLVSNTISNLELLAIGGQDLENVQSALWQSVHTLETSYALIQAMHTGLNAFENSSIQRTTRD